MIALSTAQPFVAASPPLVEFIGKGLIDVKPLITATAPIEGARDAFELSSDRSRSMKVQIAF